MCAPPLRRLLSARRALLGEGAAPLPVIGPWPLQRSLAAVNNIEPLAFAFLDCRQTLAPGSDLGGPGFQVASHTGPTPPTSLLIGQRAARVPACSWVMGSRNYSVTLSASQREPQNACWETAA